MNHPQAMGCSLFSHNPPLPPLEKGGAVDKEKTNTTFDGVGHPPGTF